MVQDFEISEARHKEYLTAILDGQKEAMKILTESVSTSSYEIAILKQRLDQIQNVESNPCNDKDQPWVDFVVCNRNRGIHLMRLLGSLAKQRTEANNCNIRVIVVDYNSIDMDTSKEITNWGLAHGVNTVVLKMENTNNTNGFMKVAFFLFFF